MYCKLMRLLFVILMLLVSPPSRAHEMTPSNPELMPAFVAGLLKTEMSIFNKRADVEYYEIGVFDKDWKSISFVTSYRVLKIEYLTHAKFDVYIREQDAKRAVFLCSLSKLRPSTQRTANVSSKICSRFK